MRLHHPRGSIDDGVGEGVRVDPERAAWDYAGLVVVSLAPGEEREFRFGEDEAILVPLAGSFRLVSNVLDVELRGRTDVFRQLTDRVYMPSDTAFRLSAQDGAELAICTARASESTGAQYRSAEDTQVEIRGGGQATRQINNVWPAHESGPEKLIVVEVITPSGNWSSYPPHKHDEWAEGESPLEEIYFYRIQGDNGFGFHRTYTADQSIDQTVVVRDGDVFLIPKGFHGPCAAAPGHDMYYLNVMAGPQREWQFSYDQSHQWVVDELASLPPDPRLPMIGGAP